MLIWAALIKMAYRLLIQHQSVHLDIGFTLLLISCCTKVLLFSFSFISVLAHNTFTQLGCTWLWLHLLEKWFPTLAHIQDNLDHVLGRAEVDQALFSNGHFCTLTEKLVVVMGGVEADPLHLIDGSSTKLRQLKSIRE